MDKSLLKKHLNRLKIPVVFLILWWILKKIKIGDLTASVQEANMGWISLAIVFIFANLGAQWLKWHVLTGMIVPGRTVRLSMQSFLGGVTLGIITPGRIGECGRAVFFNRKSWLELTGLFFIDKFMNFTALTTFSFAAVLLFRERLMTLIIDTVPSGLVTETIISIKNYRLDVFTLGFLFALAISGWIFPRFSASLFEKLLSLGHKGLKAKFSRFLMGLKLLTPRISIRAISLSFLFYFAALVQFFALVAGFERMISFNEIIFSFSIMVIFSSIPLIPGGFGTREAAAILTLGLCDISPEAALASATALYIFNVVVPAVFGWVILLRFNISGKDAAMVLENSGANLTT